MSVYAFQFYSLMHLSIVISCLYLARTRHAPGALLVAMISAGLVYDNAMLGLGATIGIGPLLETLSWPRFVLHAVLTPFMMVAATRIAIAGGIGWAASPRWNIVVWLLVVAGIVVGALENLIFLELVPSCYDGVVRYTGNLSPTQLCFEGQEAVRTGGGFPIPSVVGNLVTLIAGISLWRSCGWVWLMAGALVMFGAAAVPVSGFGLAPSNGGEVILMTGYALSVARFSRQRVG